MKKDPLSFLLGILLILGFICLFFGLVGIGFTILGYFIMVLIKNNLIYEFLVIALTVGITLKIIKIVNIQSRLRFLDEFAGRSGFDDVKSNKKDNDFVFKRVRSIDTNIYGNDMNVDITSIRNYKKREKYGDIYIAELKISNKLGRKHFSFLDNVRVLAPLKTSLNGGLMLVPQPRTQKEQMLNRITEIFNLRKHVRTFFRYTEKLVGHESKSDPVKTQIFENTILPFREIYSVHLINISVEEGKKALSDDVQNILVNFSKLNEMNNLPNIVICKSIISLTFSDKFNKKVFMESFNLLSKFIPAVNDSFTGTDSQLHKITDI